MAQIDFYLSSIDKISFVEYVLSEGGLLIPDLNYPTQNFEIVADIDEYRKFVDQSLMMFIIHETFDFEPFVWGELTKEGKDVYYISHKNGGPTIDFYSPGIISKDNLDFIGPGNISYHPYHYSPIQRSNIKAPTQLVSFYKKLSDFIKKHASPLKLTKRMYFVGDNAVKCLKSGTRLISISEDSVNEFLREYK